MFWRALTLSVAAFAGACFGIGFIATIQSFVADFGWSVASIVAAVLGVPLGIYVEIKIDIWDRER